MGSTLDIMPTRFAWGQYDEPTQENGKIRTDHEKATAAKEKGNAHFSEQQYEKAVADYSEAIELYPGDHTFYGNRSLCFMKMGKFEDALSDGQKCVELQPSWTKGYFRTGYALYQLGRFQEAADTFERGLGVDENNAALLSELAKCKKRIIAMFDENDYLSRIDRLLSMVHSSSTIMEAISSIYPDGYVDRFLRDHAKFHQNMDEFQLYRGQSDDLCEMKNCFHLKRNYRDRGNIDKCNEQKRSALYTHCESEKDMVLQQMVDQLHNSRYHLIDTGMRYEEESKESDSHYSSAKVVAMRNRLKMKRKQFDEAMGMNDTNGVMPCKFVTVVPAANEATATSKYEFGIRFFYHSFYRNNEDVSAKLPLPGAPSSSWGIRSKEQDDGNVDINADYRFCDWYVSPTKNNMKSEVMNCKKYRITMSQWRETVLKATMKWKAIGSAMRGSRPKWAIVYAVTAGSVITVKHIVSVLLYTNFTLLSCAFSETFRKTDESETDQSLKKRHSNFANWGRCLRETVDLWGDRMSESWGKSLSEYEDPEMFFYHGISRRMVFGGFHQHFKAPTSFTLAHSVAVLFASQGPDGIVITVKNNGIPTDFFDCTAFSDFGGESEMLFLGGLNALDIVGVCALKNGMKYDEWVRAMCIFDSAVQGHPFWEVVTDEDKRRIRALVATVNGKENPNIPRYVMSLFTNFRKYVSKVCLDRIGLSSKIMIEAPLIWIHGMDDLDDLFFDKKGYVKWSFIFTLFPAMKLLNICARDRQGIDIKNVLYREIRVDQKTARQLLPLLAKVCHTRRICIRIDNPSNMKAFEAELHSKAKYTEIIYERIGYVVGESQDSNRVGSWKVLRFTPAEHQNGDLYYYNQNGDWYYYS